MNAEDVRFAATLLLCCMAAAPYRRVTGSASKRRYGAALGLLVVWLVCGRYTFHAVFLAAGNVAIMQCTSRQHIYLTSLVYSWSYLVYLHLKVPSRYAIGIYQTLALRMVGLASELHTSDLVRQQTAGGLLALSAQRTSKFEPAEVLVREPNAAEMAHYAFHFIGIHKGPYYTWKTYEDYFMLPFAALGDFRAITEMKIKKAIAFGVMFLWLRTYYPPHAYEEVDFYWKKGPDYRFLYGVPQLASYVLACQVIALLSTCACSEAGLAAYPAARPVVSRARAAAVHATFGADDDDPYTDPSLSSVDPSTVTSQPFNFSTIKCFDNSAIVLGPSMRKTLKSWDMCLQYWFWAHVYRKIENRSKIAKNAITFAVWSFWCGPSVNQLILAPTLWMYVYLEDLYSERCRKLTTPAGSERIVWNVGFSLSRLLCLVYVTPCLVLAANLLRYYNSIYWAYHFILLAMALAAGALAHRTYAPARLVVRAPAPPSPQPALPQTFATIDDL